MRSCTTSRIKIPIYEYPEIKEARHNKCDGLQMYLSEITPLLFSTPQPWFYQ